MSLHFELVLEKCIYTVIYNFHISFHKEKENEELAWYEKDLSDFDWSDSDETKGEFVYVFFIHG